MRPRKRILIWGVTEDAASILRVVLETRRYAVEVAETEERLWQSDAPDVFLLVGFDAGVQEALEARLWREHRGCGVVMARARGTVAEPVWILEMLQSLHLATVRKRGPRPGWKTAANVSEEVAA